MTQEFLSAANPQPVGIYHFELRPLSLGHITHFRYFKNAFAEEREPGINDLVMGVLTCAHSYRGFREFLQRGDLPKLLKKYGKAFKVEEFPEKLKLFKAYLAEGTVSPEIEVPSQNRSNIIPGAPWIQRLRVFLMSRLHVHHEEVWDYPYAQAVWDYYTWLEQEQMIHIVGEANQQQEDVAEELVAMNKKLAEDVAKGVYNE